MKKLYLIFYLIFLTNQIFAQQNVVRVSLDKTHIDFVSEKLRLSSAQAKQFWPIYLEYHDHLNQLKKDYMSLKDSATIDGLSEQQHAQLLEKGTTIRIQQLDLESAFLEKLNKILSVQQIALLKNIEVALKNVEHDAWQNKNDIRDRLDKREDLLKNNF
jgi:hypothetical protein